MHRIGREYLMPAVIIAFPFIKVYSWTKIYRPPSLGGIFFCVLGRRARVPGARVREGEGAEMGCAAGFLGCD